MLNIVLAILILLSFPARAGWLRNFCSRHLISDHPFPYSDDQFPDLIQFYKRTHKTEILDEIIYRLRSGMLTDEEKRLFWNAFR